MRTKRSVFVWMFVPIVAVLAAGQTPVPVARASIAIDGSKPGARIPSNLYGIFFEEISHAGDGGLYAELIQNRGFEDANLPPACSLDNGFIVPPRNPHFDTNRANNWRLRWDVTSPHPAWSLETTGGAEASMDLTAEHPLNGATPHSLKVSVKASPERGAVRVVNGGYWGIGVKAGEDYKLSFFVRSDGPYSVGAQLESPGGQGISNERRIAGAARQAVMISSRETPVPVTTGGWRKTEVTLTASATDPKARLVLSLSNPGTVQFDMVSLFPATTYKNRPNGMRVDLAEKIAALRPGFIRAPGGCFAEGITVESRPQWKRSLGPIESRIGTYSPWGYWSTDGLGYHEFLQFAEDIGSDALWVVNVGVSCSFRSGTYLPDEALPGLIDDTLDAIEYAIGPVTSTWGAERAKNGHPKPFPLKYIEVGNEQQGIRYGERFAKFNAAIKAKYPQIKVALSSWISGLDRRAIDAAGKVDIVDEHAYKPVNWAIENFDSFAKYKREGWDLYIGEFATNAGVGRGNLIAALNDAAYMMSVEKNTDLVKMASYAPLLENVNKRDWEVNMIHFDSSRVYARGAYYVQKMFAEHLPSVSLPADVSYTPAAPKPITGRVGVGTWNTAAEFKDLRVERDGKVVYASDFARGAGDWAPPTGRAQGARGTWAVSGDAYRQSSETVGFSFVGDQTWTDVTINVQARKISGAEGFLVMAGSVDGRRVQWNVGGWNNRQTALQGGDAIIGRTVQMQIETGRWYDVRLEVRDRTVRGYLDGKLVNEETYPRVDTVLAIAGRDGPSGEVIIKVVNTAPEPAAVTVNLRGLARAPSAGSITVLTSGQPTDENSFDAPTKIAPITSKLSAVGQTFTHVFAPYSFSIVRVR